jgi:hypothetical protein
MNDSPQAPQTPSLRVNKEYEDPHYHDEDDVAPIEDTEWHGSTNRSKPRRKPAYRPRRRFFDD